MTERSNINRACRYYLFKDKDLIANFLLSVIISLSFIFLLFNKSFQAMGDLYIILVFYVLIVGLSMITSNSMIMNLTVKDKLNKRIDFILASGINIKDLIKSYVIEMWRLSSVVPFILFFLSYLIYDFDVRFEWLVIIFISTIMMTYFEILLLNLLSLSRRNFKFFKNLIFFGTSILIYIVGMFSKDIIKRLETHNINLIYLILGINMVLILVFATISYQKLNKINNESIINAEGSWS